MMQIGKTVTRYLGVALLLFAAGCAGGRGTHQFDPIPVGNISSSTELEPADTVKGNYTPLVIPTPLPERVEYEIKDIQNRYPKNFQTGLDRAQRYLPYAYETFGREGLPQELVWLAMVESQFNPKAVSRAGASGMWQFMPAAAKRFGLRRDSYVDERFNWKRETHAAVAYMKALYKHFNGDWALAVSAYNMGEGGLGRVITSHGNERDFWELVETSARSNSMREETQKYYPRLLATIMVAKDPEKYGFTLNPSAAEDSVEAPVQGMYALGDLDAVLGYAPGTLASLNPGLTQEMTPPGDTYNVLVPRADREEFIMALNTVQQKPHNGGMKTFGNSAPPSMTVAAAGPTHKVKKGETIAGISRKYGVSQNDLLSSNGIKSSRSLKVGQSLRIPGKSGAPAPEIAPKEEIVVASAPKEEEVSYVVKKGDTLSSVATKHGVSVASLQQWNKMGKSTDLQVGKSLKLNLPASDKIVTASAKSTDSKPTEKVTLATAPKGAYTVQKGDTLSTIATKQGVSIATLQEWNGLKDSNIKLGQKLKVATPVDSVDEIEENKEEILVAAAGDYHTVQAGEFPAAIAKSHGMTVEQLMSLNKLDKNEVLHVGDKLAVSGGAIAPVEQEEAALLVASAPEVKELAKITAPASTKAEKTTHKVAKGDTPGLIAQKYGVSTRDLLAWNNLSPKSTIQIGQQLTIYPATKAAASEAESDDSPAKEEKIVVAKAPAKEKTASKGETLTHVVSKGQTPWNIAREYGVAVEDLKRWNKWSPDHVLQVGDKVTVVKGE